MADLFLGRPRSRRYPKFNIRRDIPPVPCTVGFDYVVSAEETDPGKTFELFGNWGPEQLDRAPDLVNGGAMGGGYGRLEVLEWRPDRIRVRVADDVFPGRYNLSVFCGPRLRGISPFKSMTVRQPNPSFDYTLGASSVRLGETLELSGDWRLRFDRKPMLLYANRSKRMELEVVSWTDDLVTVRLPVLVDGTLFGYSDTELFVTSEKPYLMAGYKELELLEPTDEVLYQARVEAGIIAPWYAWFRESRRNQAIFLGVPFLLGALVFGIRGMAVASSDFVLAGLFLTLWIWPYTFGQEILSELGLLWIIEFFVIHASAFLAAMSMIEMAAPKRAGVFLGLSGLYTLFIWGFSVSQRTYWPLIFFWTLTATKFAPLFMNNAKAHGRTELVARAGVAMFLYVIVSLMGGILPIPLFGWSTGIGAGGLIDDDSAHRILFMGTVYFLLLGFSEMAALKIIQNSSQAIAKG